MKPANSIKIREYFLEDKSACLDVFLSNCPEYFVPSEIESFGQFLSDADARYYAVEENSKIIGCGGFHINRWQNEATLSWAMVQRSFHNRSIGRQLLQHRLQAIRDVLGKATVRLDTSQHTYKFYEKFGFKVDKITKDHYGKGLDRYDMSLELK